MPVYLSVSILFQFTVPIVTFLVRVSVIRDSIYWRSFLITSVRYNGINTKYKYNKKYDLIQTLYFS